MTVYNELYDTQKNPRRQNSTVSYVQILTFEFYGVTINEEIIGSGTVLTDQEGEKIWQRISSTTFTTNLSFQS